MDAIEFVNRYSGYIKQLEMVVKPKYLPAIKKLRQKDPHDIIKPEHYLNSEAEAFGVVCRLFLRMANPKLVKLSKQEGQSRLKENIRPPKKSKRYDR